MRNLCYDRKIMELKKKTLQHTILLITILAVGIFVRVYDFGNTPYGLNQDEASTAYDAWADMNYGMDRNGDHNPIYAVAWGSGQNMLYNYVLRPFIAVFGLNIVTTRLPMVLFGILSMIIFYLFTKKLFGDKVAILAIFILATCPWHIIASRWAVESNFAIPVIMFAMYCFARIKDNGIWFIPGMILLGLLMYAYSCHLFFLITFIPAVCLYLIKNKMVRGKYLIIGIAAFLFVALPMGLLLIVNQFDFEPIRFMGFSIPKFSELRTSGVVNVFNEQDNRSFLHALMGNTENLLNMLFLFQDTHNYNAPKHFGALYLFMMPFMYAGIASSIKKLQAGDYGLVLVGLWFCCMIPQFLFIPISIVRINIIFFSIIVMVSIGVLWISERIRRSIHLVVASTLIVFMLFCWYYFNDFNKYIARDFYGGLDEAIEYVTDHTQGDIYLTATGGGLYVISLFAEKIPPSVFLDSVQYTNFEGQFRSIARYKNYICGIPSEITPREGDAYIYQMDETINPTLITGDNQYNDFGNYTVIIVGDEAPSHSD